MSMAQLFLTNPVIIFHPPILSGAAIYCEYSTFPNDRDIFLRGKFQRRFFFSANAGLRFNRDSFFFALRFSAFSFLLHTRQYEWNEDSGGPALTSLVFPIVKGSSARRGRHPKSHRPLLRFKQVARDGVINFDYVVETSERVERARACASPSSPSPYSHQGGPE